MKKMMVILLTVMAMAPMVQAALSFSPSGSTMQKSEYVETGVRLDGMGDFTWEAWVKPSAAGWGWTENRVMGQTDWASEGRLILEIRKNKNETGNMPKFALFYRVNGANKRLCAASALTGDWAHVAVTRAGSRLALYVNGVCEATAEDYAGPLPDVPFSFAFAYAGALSDVRVWNTVRSADEIAAAQASTLTGSESGLVGLWLLDETYGAPANKAGAKEKAVVRGYNTSTAAMTASITGRGNLWHVKPSGNDTAAAADATGLTSFGTIQAAVDASAAGDVIWSDPGTYDSGEHVAVADEGGDGVALNRVWINKNITLISTGGRECTIIAGRQIPTGYGGRLGEKAVRCLGFGSSATTAIVRGFTLADGATQYNKDLSATTTRQGGGVCSYKSGTNNWLVDCTIQNCAAVQAGGAFQVNAVRCLFKGNWVGTPDGIFSSGAAMRACRLVWCVLTGNSGSGGVCVYPAGIYNCTFCGNEIQAVHYASTPVTLYNCVFDDFVNDRSEFTLSACASYATFHKVTQADGTVMGDKNLMLAPLLGDGRLLTTSAALGICPAATKTKLPAAYCDLDYELKSVDFNHLNPGAWQHPVTPAGGRIELRSTSVARTGVNGAFVPASHTNYVWALQWPTQYLFQAKAVNASQAVRNADNFYDGAAIYSPTPPLDANDSCWIVAPPAGHTSAYSASACAKSYIDRTAIFDGAANGTADKPFRSFKEAIDAKLAATYATQVFYVRPGIYDNDDMTSVKYGYKARVVMPDYVNARFVAVEGADKTFIVGAADPDAVESECGCGPAAVRLTGQEGNGPFVTFTGFTLTGGRANFASTDSGVSQTVNYGTVGRATLGNYSWGRWSFNDCIVSNNVSSQNLIVGGTYTRCLLVGNTVLNAAYTSGPEYLALARGAYFLSCLFRGNVSPDSLTRTSTLVQCTVDAAATSPFRDGYVYNSIATADDVAASYNLCFGTVVDGCGTAGSGCVAADPEFVAAAAGDYRLYQTSPAVGFAQTAESGNWWRYATGDYTGAALRFLPDGTGISGARQDYVRAVQVSSAQDRGVSPLGRVLPDGQNQITVTATEAATRNLLGFAVDGVLTAAVGNSWTYTVPETIARAPVIEAVYATNWYVNAVAGSNAETGVDAAHAKKTLAAALRYAIPGDVVHAAAGVYDEGGACYEDFITATQDNAITLLTRAVVPDGVTLTATEGRTVTFIAGAAASKPDAYGCGADAVRCAYVGAGARLCGFTLTGGRAGDVNASPDDRSAAGVMAAGITSEIVDCTVSNCIAPRTAVGWGGLWRRCRIVGNRASSFNSGLRDARVLGCYFDDNVGNGLLYSMRAVKYTTFGPGNCGLDGAPASAISGCYADTEISDCVFGYWRVFGNERANTFVRCVLPSNHNIDTTKCTIDDSCQIVDPAELAFEGAWGLTRTNPAVDAGNREAWDVLVGGTTDANGGARVYNGAIDVGGVEYDWRPRYGACICPRARFTVTQASEQVREVDGRVYLPDGQLLAVYRRPSSMRLGRYVCRVEVTGSGVLELSLDGAVVQRVGAGTHEFMLTSAQLETQVAWRYSPGVDDAGGAYIDTFASKSGLKVTVQ